MQQLLDYLAIIAFAVVYFASKDIFLATGILMVGVTLQVIAYKVMSKPIGNELKITFWVSMAIGWSDPALQGRSIHTMEAQHRQLGHRVWRFLAPIGFAKTFLAEESLGPCAADCPTKNGKYSPTAGP